MGQLLDHIGPALCLTGDQTLVQEGLVRVLARGNGAGQQRTALESTGHLPGVMEALADITAGQPTVAPRAQ